MAPPISCIRNMVPGPSQIKSRQPGVTVDLPPEKTHLSENMDEIDPKVRR
ncbi:hypothetical protein ACEYYB_11765 [Paracoccus sp. p4-l81]